MPMSTHPFINPYPAPSSPLLFPSSPAPSIPLSLPHAQDAQETASITSSRSFISTLSSSLRRLFPADMSSSKEYDAVAPHPHATLRKQPSSSSAPSMSRRTDPDTIPLPSSPLTPRPPVNADAISLPRTPSVIESTIPQPHPVLTSLPATSPLPPPRRPARRTLPPIPQGIAEEVADGDETEVERRPSRERHLLGGFEKRFNKSTASLGMTARKKAERVLGLDPLPHLASLYLVSGLGKDPDQWTVADPDAHRGILPLEDSLGIFWRPDVLGNTFSGQGSDKSSGQDKRHKASGSLASVLNKDVASKAFTDAGPDGANKLVSRAMKYAHPKDVEVVNSSLPPPAICHSFSFTIPRANTLSDIAKTASVRPPPPTTPLNTGRTVPAYDQETSYVSITSRDDLPLPRSPSKEDLRAAMSSNDLTFHGVTLTVWSPADKERAVKLAGIKEANDRRRHSTTFGGPRRARRDGEPWPSRAGVTSVDFTVSEAHTILSDSEVDHPGADMTDRRASEPGDAVPEDVAAAYGDSSDVFWMPYAITLVSRHPIYGLMEDYLRLSWTRYSKDAKLHMKQICRLLDRETPRPGEIFGLQVGTHTEDEVVLEAVMPGSLDFEKGTIRVDFQMWPLFQALDIDHILTCMEVALSNSGRVIFCSRYPAMLAVAVNTLKYIVDLRGWIGTALPLIHARDATFLIEDPGPYIIGIPTECRYLIHPPAEVFVVDIDLNTVKCKSAPVGVVTPRQKRDKARHRIQSALGSSYPAERSVPSEYKIGHPKGTFRNVHRVIHGEARPRWLGERLRPPQWWRQHEVIAAFDKIMIDKHKKPTLLQRLTGSGMARVEAQLSVNEQLAKIMMRKRALHYVETRDDFDLKVARINRRLQQLVQEGDHWKSQFEVFEKYAERLTRESTDLKAKIERERREARRLSAVASEQNKQNVELHERLEKTEAARAEAMRQLSDMHQSIQDLEREREDIMSSIEMQITSVIASLPPDGTSTQPQSPTSTMSPLPETEQQTTGPLPLSSFGAGGVTVPRRFQRPDTRDSAKTGMSRFTAESAPVSVLGAYKGSVKRGKGDPGSEALGAVDRMISDKSASIAERMAMIQAKLELALKAAGHDVPFTAQEGGSGASTYDTEDDKETNSPIAVTDGESRTQTHAERDQTSPTSPTTSLPASDTNGLIITVPTASEADEPAPSEKTMSAPATPSKFNMRPKDPEAGGRGEEVETVEGEIGREEDKTDEGEERITFGDGDDSRLSTAPLNLVRSARGLVSQNFASAKLLDTISNTSSSPALPPARPSAAPLSGRLHHPFDVSERVKKSSHENEQEWLAQLGQQQDQHQPQDQYQPHQQLSPSLRFMQHPSASMSRIRLSSPTQHRPHNSSSSDFQGDTETDYELDHRLNRYYGAYSQVYDPDRHRTDSESGEGSDSEGVEEGHDAAARGGRSGVGAGKTKRQSRVGGSGRGGRGSAEVLISLSKSHPAGLAAVSRRGSRNAVKPMTTAGGSVGAGGSAVPGGSAGASGSSPAVVRAGLGLGPGFTRRKNNAVAALGMYEDDERRASSLSVMTATFGGTA